MDGGKTWKRFCELCKSVVVIELVLVVFLIDGIDAPDEQPEEEETHDPGTDQDRALRASEDEVSGAREDQGGEPGEGIEVGLRGWCHTPECTALSGHSFVGGHKNPRSHGQMYLTRG